MELKEKIWKVVLPILVLAGFVLIGFASWHLVNHLKGYDPVETPSTKDEIEKVENTKSLTESQAEAYNSLITLDRSYGFYFDKNVSIDSISDFSIIKYALNNYVKENNVSLDNDLTCLEFKTEYCKDVTFPSVKNDDIAKYIKDKFNTTKAFELTQNNVPDQFIDAEEYVTISIHNALST